MIGQKEQTGLVDGVERASSFDARLCSGFELRSISSKADLFPAAMKLPVMLGAPFEADKLEALGFRKRRFRIKRTDKERKISESKNKMFVKSYKSTYITRQQQKKIKSNQKRHTFSYQAVL